ncbi:type II toxin-antitoxin system PemK/MazF family toxin [Afifella sp. JA880]|uniref:type II toxin-antitoxin system PemK/MazF family toxin n=1 Tax=Afifella sp. JA880 TaxID=2975280 RepID=UPI0021BA526E|nr:type II toxin-antitoxin system PemK/MazF family toxin [Afifella sp. JA880]MCT8266813.1 type II toxin-antitoxin system PemK/MazF family toxin [Afifella sp. JA880]
MATLPDPRPGLVIRCAYLWRFEAARGVEEGLKDRPCAVVLATQRSEGRTTVVVAPITHRPPTSPEAAIEIPPGTKARLGLDPDQSWIIADDLNYFLWPGPDLRPVDPKHLSKGFAFGYLPGTITKRLIEVVRRSMRQGSLKPVDRDRPR